jgi:CTP synthase (UTP-ammonia lyase)
MTKIALIGDFSEQQIAHVAIPIALRGAAAELGVPLSWDWIHTSALPVRGQPPLDAYAAAWCVPGSPYANPDGVFNALGFMRKSQRPFLGTCAGFQHALIEYARGEWQLPAQHAEYAPDAPDPLIAPLVCPLVQVSEQIQFEPRSRLRAIYGVDATCEEYQCRLGFNPSYRAWLDSGPLRVAARDDRGDVRAVELDGHPFFIACLFQPERGALKGRTPALAKAFVAAAIARTRAAHPDGSAQTTSPR